MLYCGDNLTLLRQHVADASVDLVYADPPFNSGKSYFATDQKQATNAAAAYDDRWSWDASTQTDYQTVLRDLPAPYTRVLKALFELIGPSASMAYLVFLAPRLAELQRALKPSGSLYVHCDVRMSHYLRLLLDGALGRENFRNEIVWGYRTGGAGKRQFSRKHDVILFYSASKTYIFHPQYERVRYAKPFFDAKRDDHGYYADVLLRDVWEIPAVINVSKDRTGYPTQKPLALLERVVRASTNEGDCVLDPFCGSGTTLVAAQQLGRSFIGMDMNADAIRIAGGRLAASSWSPAASR